MTDAEPTVTSAYPASVAQSSSAVQKILEASKESHVVTLFLRGQKPEHVQLARDSWNIPFEILEDEQLTLAKQLSEAKHGNVTIHPTAWHPLITSRPAVGHDPKHPEYDYPQGMSQPAVILFAKRTEENALEKSMYSLKSLYFWAGKNATPRPKPSDCARHVVKVVGAYEEGKPIPGLRHESGYSMGHVFCVGKRSLCQIQ